MPLRDDHCPYHLVRMIRQGALASVFEGVDDEGGVAIVKQLSAQRAAGDPVVVARFEREIALSIMNNQTQKWERFFHDRLLSAFGSEVCVLINT